MKRLLQLSLVTCLLILPAVLAAPGPALAQAPITATVDRTTLSTDETLMLTITLQSDAQDVSPELPTFEGFDVVGSSTAREISLSSGGMTVQNKYTFQLRPIEAGTLTIPAVGVTIGGQAYSTDPIPITVTQGQGLAAPTPLLGGVPGGFPGGLPGGIEPGGTVPGGGDRGRAFVTAEVDTTRPFVGEKVLYTFRLYRDQTLRLRGQPRYVEPAFTGFWNKYEPEQTQHTAQIGDRFYDVAELRTVLFPTTEGPATIEPASLILPGGLFTERTQLESEAIAMDVQPLPADAPDGFDGAVGQYRIDASVDSPQGRVDEPITLVVTLAGEGNLDALPDPAWPDPPAGWRAFEGKSTTNTEAKDGTVRGVRRYERLLVPDQPGEATLDPIRYVTFDPETGTYETLTTRPIPVSIAPGTAGGAADVPGSASGAGSPADAAADVSAATGPAGELGPLMAVQVGSALGALGNRPAGMALLWLMPLALLAGDVAWRRWRRHRAEHRPRPTAVHHEARALLAQAHRPGADASALVEQALTESATARLGHSARGLTRAALAGQLIDSGVDPALARRLEAVLVTCEGSRYAPAGASDAATAALIAEAEAVVAALERTDER